MTSAPSPEGNLRDLLQSKSIVICCGPGGVGKTTTAAAIGLMAAVRENKKVLVVTVDPALRLSDALGVDRLGDQPSRIELSGLQGSGKGELWASMLNTSLAWDNLVRRYAPDQATIEKILSSTLYANVSRRFVQSHDYVAAERLYELHQDGDYDLIVIDTPPSRHAIDFLDAPSKMAEFFSSKLLRWILAPYRSRWVGLASRPFTQIADRILGGAFLAEVAEFFYLFHSMYEGFITRSTAVENLLADPACAFVVVTTLSPGPRHEASYLIRELGQRGFHLAAIVANKVLPSYLADPLGRAAAARLRQDHEAISAAVAPQAGLESEILSGVLAELARNYRDYSHVALREAEERGRLGFAKCPVLDVAHLEHDIDDVFGLAEMGEMFWPQRGSQQS